MNIRNIEYVSFVVPKLKDGDKILAEELKLKVPKLTMEDEDKYII